MSEDTAVMDPPPEPIEETPARKRRSLFAILGLNALSNASLVEFCRSIRFFLSSGMTLRDAMSSLGQRGTFAVAGTARKIGEDLSAGWSFQDSLERRDGRFPPLFIGLTTVGEETGNLPEVMKDLEQYYILQQQMKREFRSQVSLPLIQLVLAVSIITLFIYVLGIFAPNGKINDQEFDPLRLGLRGEGGAITFASIAYGSIFGVWLLGWLLHSLLSPYAIFDRIALYVPLVGPCLRAMAITRFSFAMQLMLSSSMSILRTIRLALMSTDNGAFSSNTDKAESLLRRGNTLHSTVESVGLFPQDYLSAVAMGEETGHLPEVMKQQAEEYDETARRRLRAATRFAAMAIWLGIATFIIVIVFNFYLSYKSMIEKAISTMDRSSNIQKEQEQQIIVPGLKKPEGAKPPSGPTSGD